MHQNNINVSQERLRLISRGTLPPAAKASGFPLPLDPNAVINNEKHDTNDYTPDEALSIISVLSDAVADWMVRTKAYQKFRAPSKA